MSVGSVSRALRLTPEERQAVRQGKRPLIPPRTPAVPPMSTIQAVPPVITPVIMGPRERLREIVRELGLDVTLDLLAATEKVAA